MADETPLRYTQYDTSPAIEEDLEERDPDTGVWAPMDLTGKTVRLLAQHRVTKRRFGGAASLVTVAVPQGETAPTRVQYTLQGTDLTEAGDYYYEWEISAGTGDRRTVPGGGAYRQLSVAAKLGAVA